jgi:hypothetical protein
MTSLVAYHQLSPSLSFSFDIQDMPCPLLHQEVSAKASGIQKQTQNLNYAALSITYDIVEMSRVIEENSGLRLLGLSRQDGLLCDLVSVMS